MSGGRPPAVAAPSPAEELEFDLGTLRIAAKGWGEHDATPLLALHGWLDNAASFDRLAPLLPHLRLVALDMPGHGLSSHRPAGCRSHIWDDLPELLQCADQLGWQRFHLLGHSRGAGIATLLAAAVPERVISLTLI
ncbi:MAG TPA: alpha/beta fold hydrolase, partial [Pseudomonadales bacterium]|nr:alpha/beta fold hydrolase [Pseudomonadales bacterium]